MNTVEHIGMFTRESERVRKALELAKEQPTRERQIAYALISLGWVDELSGTLETLAEEIGEILEALG